MKPKECPTQERLRELLDYDPETGVFTRKASKGNIKAGQEAGCTNPRGYIQIRIDGSLYLAHRLAFVWMEGSIDRQRQVDHIDGDPSNNRWANLRLTTQSQNAANSRKPKHYRGAPTASRFKGVHRTSSKKSPWTSQIRNPDTGERVYLGCFPTEELAHEAYVSAIPYFYGEFGRAA